jgi:hypothetical protein
MVRAGPSGTDRASGVWSDDDDYDRQVVVVVRYAHSEQRGHRGCGSSGPYLAPRSTIRPESPLTPSFPVGRGRIPFSDNNARKKVAYYLAPVVVDRTLAIRRQTKSGVR